MEHVLGVDLGGTKVKAGVVGADGRLHSSVVEPSGEGHGQAAWAQVAIEAAATAIELAAVAPSAIGLAVPGAIDAERAVLLDMAARLPSAGIDLAALFAGFGLPVYADNDANAALAAERRWGGHDSANDMVLLTIGTGIGSAVVIGGRPIGEGRPLGGNLAGHLTIDTDGTPCICGNLGCGETVASATALVSSARRRGLDVERAEDVFDADATGDVRATAAIDGFLDGLATIVVNSIHAYQPDVIVLAGGVMAREERILPSLMTAVEQRAWTIPRGSVRLVASRFGDRSGVLGAAAIALGGRLA